MWMHLLTLQSVLFAIHFILPGVQSNRWLALKPPPSDLANINEFYCPSRKRMRNRLLTRKQRKMCRRNPGFMKYVVEAIELTKTECLKQAKYEQWDCSAILKAPKFSHDLREGTRQSAFVHALSSAALVFAITRSCEIDRKCRCGKIPNKDILRTVRKKKRLQWAACHDNIGYGIRLTKQFLHHRGVNHRKVDKMMMNLHNNFAGRMAVRESLKITCRCHGLTGGCPVLTCTRQLPVSFSGIAKKLFQQYKAARQVRLHDDKGKKRLVPKSKKAGKKIDDSELVYLDRSRNFCNKDVKRGLPGTHGRECARRSEKSKSDAPDACDHLCCGRGHKTKAIHKTTECRCRFVFNTMSVKCKKCVVTEMVSTCR